MKFKIIILGFLASVAWSSCEKNLGPDREQVNTDSSELLGSWTDPIYSDTLITYKKVNILPDNDYGFTIAPGNKFMEHKNSGWCGTPPVAYSDYEGTWTRSDSILNIHVPYWGGTMDMRWMIIAMDQHHITLYTVSVDYHLEEGKD